MPSELKKATWYCKAFRALNVVWKLLIDLYLLFVTPSLPPSEPSCWHTHSGYNKTQLILCKQGLWCFWHFTGLLDLPVDKTCFWPVCMRESSYCWLLTNLVYTKEFFLFVVLVCLFVLLFTHSRCSFTTKSGTCQIWAKQFLLVVKFVDQFRSVVDGIVWLRAETPFRLQVVFRVPRLVVVTGWRCFRAPAQLVRQHAHCVTVLYARILSTPVVCCWCFVVPT